MKKLSFINIELISYFLLIFLLSINTASATKLYKWVDSQGRISYQDKPPPSSSKILSEKTLKKKNTEKEESKNKINNKPIDVYVTKVCQGCENTIALLKGWGVPFSEKLIEDHRVIQTKLIELTGGVTVPALFNGEEFLEDTSSNNALRASLEKTGHLKKTISSETKKSESKAK